MKNKKQKTEKNVSLKRILKAMWGIKLPWLHLILYGATTVLMLAGSLLMAGATGDMIDEGGNVATVTLICFSAAYLIIGAGATLNTIFSGLAGERINVGLRQKLWRKLMYIPMKHYDKDGGETLVSRITTDCDYASALLVAVIGVITSIFSVFGYVMSMLAMNMQISLGIIAIVPLSFIIGILYSKAKFWLGQKTQAALSETTYYLIERTKDLPLIKVSNMSDAEIERGKAAFDEQYKMDVYNGYLTVTYSTVETALNIASVLITFIIGGVLVQQEILTVGTVVEIYAISSALTTAFSSLINQCGTVRHAIGSMSRIVIELEMVSENATEGASMDVPNEDIRFENVSFAYDNAMVLKDVSCIIPKNKVTAIIGANGSGKTTVFKLLERMHQPGNGTIYFGEAPAEGFSLESWRRAFGLVSQDRPVLEGTIRDNIIYGCQRDISEEELWQVAKMANLEDLIKSLPDGFNTYVAPGGRNFSGGQCQCIAIARALMHNPDYLLLDEATSNLDVKSEKVVTDAINTLMEGRTTIIIAHSLSAIRHADHVLVIKDGTIAANGSPADIIKTSTDYQAVVTGA